MEAYGQVPNKFDSKRRPRSLDIDLEIDRSVAAEDDADEPQKIICQIWTVGRIGLKFTEAVEDAYGQVSTKSGSKLSPRSLVNHSGMDWLAAAAADNVDEPLKNLCQI